MKQPYRFQMLPNRLPSARSLLALGLLSAAVLLAAPRPVPAMTSDWVSAAGSKLRLVSAEPTHERGDGLWAGVQIRLAPGWKTYWRNPGDSGVPPHFDWSGSENVKQVEVLYPAPETYPEAGGAAYGYKDEVLFPLRVTPERREAPVHLKLRMEYGLCKDLCIPSEAELSMTIDPAGKKSISDGLLLDRYLALVPSREDGEGLPSITAVTPELEGAEPKLLIDALFPKSGARADLYIEAEDGYVPPAIATGPLQNGKQRFVVTFRDAREAEALAGKQLTLTLVADAGARETTWRLP